MINLSITAAEAALIADLLKPRAILLTELLEAQVQACPQGCLDWADTADALAVANGVLVKVRNGQISIAEEMAR